MTLKWKETDTGDQALYAGEIKVGGVFYSGNGTKQSKAFSTLPSIKSSLGWFDSLHEAQQAVESAVKAWFEATEKEVAP